MIGTHAIVQQDVRFARLGLVIDRRTAQIRRTAAGRPPAGPAVAPLSGHDGDPHSPHREHDAVWRPGRDDPPRDAARPAGSPHLPRRTGEPVPLVEFCARETACRKASVRGRPAGRRIAKCARGKRGRSLRATHERRAVGVSRGSNSRTHVARAKKNKRWPTFARAARRCSFPQA